MADRDHIILLKKNSAISFRYLYDKYSGLVYYVATKMGLQKEVSEEIVQETFLKLWEKRQDLDESLSIKSYIITIAKNYVLKSLRKRTYDLAYKKYYEYFFSDETSEMENEINYKDMLQHAQKIIDQLPEVQKKIFILNKISHLSVDKIAIELSLSRRTVENQLYRAKKKIMDYMKTQKWVSENR